MAQQFEPTAEQPGYGGELRAQRMTADESRAVIAQWQQERVEQTGLTDKPAVPDVAEGLDITVEDVQRLLQDVRAKRLKEERSLALEQELAEIRLAEEERKLAEIRHQRAELRREQAEVRANPPRRTPRVEPHYLREQELGERHSIRNQEALDESSYLSTYFYAGIIIVFTLFIILSNVLK